MSNKEVIQLAGGDEVPVYLVKALEEFEKVWPGATLSQARPAIVAAILKAQKANARSRARKSNTGSS